MGERIEQTPGKVGCVVQIAGVGMVAVQASQQPQRAEGVVPAAVKFIHDVKPAAGQTLTQGVMIKAVKKR
jgi:hypothetical protein